MAYAYPPAAPASSTAPIIGPQFCAPHPVDVAIIREVKTIKHGSFVVTDINGDILFKVKGAGFLSMHDHRVLMDATGIPILTLKQKIMTAHDRWQVFRGDSTESSDLICTAKRSSMFQFKTKLDVFLANNTKEEVCDFKVKGSWSEKSCVIYAGESSNIVAQMHTKNTFKSMLIGKDKFMVTVNPNIDYAFIVALIVVLDGINAVAKQGAAGASAGSSAAVAAVVV
ncbi:hypothetical protein COLO4_06873 [Corchorus olitorius]|uniref:LURP1-like domain-containing protein n=1 Tax=Corchorus olitorius TaxID=93759 RepID=A0A1R3KLP1_9ROSI|nr:hypothetical protein COLO4_06873 [Corchorus olitorius]